MSVWVQWRGCGLSNSTPRRLMCKRNTLLIFNEQLSPCGKGATVYFVAQWPMWLHLHCPASPEHSLPYITMRGIIAKPIRQPSDDRPSRVSAVRRRAAGGRRTSRGFRGRDFGSRSLCAPPLTRPQDDLWLVSQPRLGLRPRRRGTRVPSVIGTMCPASAGKRPAARVFCQRRSGRADADLDSRQPDRLTAAHSASAGQFIRRWPAGRPATSRCGS